jgi:hypothetical protein
MVSQMIALWAVHAVHDYWFSGHFDIMNGFAFWALAGIFFYGERRLNLIVVPLHRPTDMLNGTSQRPGNQ